MADKANIYIFTGESYLIRKNVGEIKGKIDNPELNVTEYKTIPTADELLESCAQVPFLADRRLVCVWDCTALGSSGSAQEAKKIASYLGRIPETTCLILCLEGQPDKRRALYRYVYNNGTVRAFEAPTPAACAAFVQKTAKQIGAQIGLKEAQALVSLAGCDYDTLENEINKLAVYSGFSDITQTHIKECASRTMEYNVFMIHNLLASRQADKAFALLDEILVQERPEALIGLFARKIRDMYKVKTMRDAGFSQDRIIKQLGMKSYAVQMLTKECARFSADALRSGIKMLADLDFGIKSGTKDAALALHAALVSMYDF